MTSWFEKNKPAEPYREIERLTAEIDTIRKERDNWKAHAISRGKRLRQARDRFINIRDELDDEGDRIYFGSTNHADQFKEEVAWLDDFKWDKIMGEPEDWDLLGAMEKQTARANAAEVDRDAAITRAEAADGDVIQLREIISKCADALNNGAAISLDCSIEFMQSLPSEIGLHVASVVEDRDQWKERADAAEAKVAKLREVLIAVELWWLTAGMLHFDGAPAAIFKARAILQETEQ